MSKGLSWRQHTMLASIAREAVRWSKKDRDKPVAWRAIDYGPTSGFEKAMGTSDEARVAWNIEQATRRALRSLERRGLVKLDRYCFRPYAEMPRGTISPQIFWHYVHPDDHVPGDSRTMTGVLLTKAGWALVAEQEAKRKATKRG